MTNRAFEDLERRCVALNRKIFFKWFISILILFGLVCFAIFKIYFTEKKITPAKNVKRQEKNVSIKQVKRKQVIIVSKKSDINSTLVKKDINESLPKPETYKTLILKPNIVIPKINQKNKKVNVSKKEENLTQVSVANKPKITAIDKNQSQRVLARVNISIKTMPSEQSLIESNSKDEDFNSALNLSLFYFKSQKYEKAIFFSKRANHYNPSSAKPWLIYAKAKVKQNKSAEAIKALETYLSYFSSDDAENLLISIKGTK